MKEKQLELETLFFNSAAPCPDFEKAGNPAKLEEVRLTGTLTIFFIAEGGEVCCPAGPEAREGGILGDTALAPAQGQPEGNPGILRRNEDCRYLWGYRGGQRLQETKGEQKFFLKIKIQI